MTRRGNERLKNPCMLIEILLGLVPSPDVLVLKNPFNTLRIHLHFYHNNIQLVKQRTPFLKCKVYVDD